MLKQEQEIRRQAHETHHIHIRHATRRIEHDFQIGIAFKARMKPDFIDRDAVSSSVKENN